MTPKSVKRFSGNVMPLIKDGRAHAAYWLGEHAKK